MNPTQANSRECLQQEIDAEIKSLEKSIRALKHRRNALAPISSLPPEVFITIFSLLYLPGIPSLGGESYRSPALRRVTHVCHQWREIALNQPLLWSHVDFTTLSSAGVTEVLLRSKSVPLYLEAKFYGHDYDNVGFGTFQEELQAHFPRICHLYISAKPSHLLHILEKLVSPAPTLEYLSISSSGEYGNTVDLLIPDTLFDGSAPELSRLELRNFHISWHSPLLKGLKHLEILRSGSARPELSVWLGMLDQIPQLETLILHSASPVSPPFPFDVERTITLPFLTHLGISTSPRDCALALAHLNLPAISSLCLTLNYNNTNMLDMLDLLPYVVQHAHGTQDAQSLQSMLIRDVGWKVDILAWPAPDIDPAGLFGTTLPPRVALTFKCEEQPDYYILFRVTWDLPLRGLAMLSVESCSTTQNWDYWLLRASWKCPLLQYVRLEPPAEREFLKMLLEDRSKDLMFRSLTVLALEHTELDAAWTLSMCDLLMQRVEQGVPLETLDLRKCRLHWDRRRGYPAAVQLFSEIVVNVLGPEEIFEYN
jgi:hypothetical protein